MAEHSELVQEMQILEKLNTEERLRMARKRRSQQLKKWSQREKEYSTVNKKRAEEIERKNSNRGVKFVSSVILLEAATRNDVDEGKILHDS